MAKKKIKKRKIKNNSKKLRHSRKPSDKDKTSKVKKLIKLAKSGKHKKSKKKKI